MSDHFIYGNNSFMPEYLPGIIGYGQNGAPGDNGEDGNTIFYSSYDLSRGSKDLSKVKNAILSNKQLSNNLDILSDEKYKEGDLIIDKTGSFYYIKTLSNRNVVIESCANTISSIYSDITKKFNKFDVVCNTSFLKSSNKKWEQDNPNYINDPDRLSYSMKVYHHNRLEEKIYGNFVNFKLTTSGDISDYTYKFVLVMPTGQTFDYYSDTPSATIFLENKYIYGCFSINTWSSIYDLCKTNMNLEDTKIQIAEELNVNINSSKTLGEFIYNTNIEKGENIVEEGEKGPHNNAERFDNAFKNLNSKDATVLCSLFIKAECSAYAEIIEKSTGKVYRIDIDDIFINNDLSQNKSQVEHIRETTNNMSWSVSNYIYNAGNVNFLTYKYRKIQNEQVIYEEDRQFNPFNAYVMWSEEDDINSAGSLTEDGTIQTVHFVDSSGLAVYTNEISAGGHGEWIEEKTNIPSGEDSNELVKEAVFKKWYIDKNENIDYNRTLRLTFNGLKSISINVVYQKLAESLQKASGEIIDYPQALIYIGYIDTPLLLFEKEGERDPGIWYLTKFVPPGYYIDEEESGYVKTSYAGVIDTTINMAEYNKDDGGTHFIEIGITLLDMYNENSNRENINLGHRPTTYVHTTAGGNVIDDAKYSFLTSEDSGDPDVKIYVSAVKETDENVLSAEPNEEFDYSLFNKIHVDYPPKDIEEIVQ